MVFNFSINSKGTGIKSELSIRNVIVPKVAIAEFNKREGQHTARIIRSLLAPTHEYYHERRLPSKLLFILDLEEKLENIQGGLRGLVHLGIESGFCVVEPFIYKSHIQRKFAFPEQFLDANLIPQPASLFFYTRILFNTNRYIPYSLGLDRIRLVQLPMQNATGESIHIIHAAVFFDWLTSDGKRKASKGKNRFYPCNHHLKRLGMKATPYGWSPSRNVHIYKAICVRAYSNLNPTFFRNLFSFVGKKTKPLHPHLQCKSCLSIALLKSNPHAFQDFASNLRAEVYTQENPPLFVSSTSWKMANRVRNQSMDDKQPIAVHLHTREAFKEFQKIEKQDAASNMANKPAQHEMFQTWLGKCIKKLATKARQEISKLEAPLPIYVASDIFRDRWDNDEKDKDELFPFAVSEVLDQASQYLKEELGPFTRFVPPQYGISQDVMAMSDIIDACVCFEAKKYITASPNNFGVWIHDQRASLGRPLSTIPIECPLPIPIRHKNGK